MDKKKIVIALVIFIFLGLTIFTFANPADDENLGGNNNNDNIEEVNKENNNDNTNNNVNGITNNENSNNNNITNNENAGNVIQPVGNINDDTYNAALKAVVSAEDKLDNDSYSEALSLVNKVTNEEQKEELSKRLDEVKKGIDVKTLVTTLETKTNSAANKLDMTDARNYRSEENIESLVSGLTNETLKKDLQEKLVALSKILDDTTNPIVNIEDGAILSKNTTVTVEDDNEVTIKLSKNGGESVEIENNTLLTEGNYTLTVIDSAFNEVTISFTIDTSAPKFNPEKWSYTLEVDQNANFECPDMTQYVTDDLSGVDRVVLDTWYATNTSIPDQTKVGKFVCRYFSYDKAGNMVSNDIFYNVVDTTAPEVKLFDDRNNSLQDGAATIKEVKAIITDNSGSYTATLTDYKGNSREYVSGTFVGRGNWTLTVKDASDNTTTVTFKVDKDYPLVYLNGTKNEKVNTNVKYFNKDVTLKVSDLNLDTVVLTKDGNEISYNNEMVISEEGKYVVTATDIVGHKTQVTFVIDKTKPVLSLKNDTVGTDPYSKISFKLYDNTGVAYYVLNGTKRTVSVNKWSDANYNNIKSLLVDGENTIELYDVAGNKTKLTFNYDTVLPEVVLVKQEYETKENGRVKTTVVFSEKVEYPFDNLNWRKVSDTEYFTYFYREKDYTINFKDAALNENSYTIKVNLETQTINLYDNITLIDEPFYNVGDNIKNVNIEGNGKTVTEIVTSQDKFYWTENGTNPVMGDMFASASGQNITVKNMTFAGTVQSILLGQYRGATTSSNYNTTLDNVTIKNLEVVSYGTDSNTNQNFAPAVIAYGNVNLKNVIITGTKLSSMDTEGYDVFDLAAVNHSNTTIDGGEIGNIYLWAQAKMTIKNAKIGDIVTTPNTKGGLTIASGTTVDKIIVKNNVPFPSLTIESGATVDVLDVTNAKSHAYITINGMVNKVLTIEGEKTLADYLIWKVTH